MRQADATGAAALALRHGGFLTPRQLSAAGFDEDLARREVAARRWQRPLRGYYVPNTDPLTDVLLARIATAYAGRASLLTGLIAARALQMRWVPTLPGAQVLVPAGVRRPSSRLVHVRRCAALHELTPTLWQDVRLAPAARVVLDGALRLDSLRDVRGLVLGAVADELTTPEELAALLAGEPFNGTALLRQAVGDAADGAASPPEAEMADALRGCRQPFLLNPELWIDGQLVGSPDGYFLGLGAGWEVDSRERHEGDESFDDTLGRHTRFGGHGLVLAHPTPKRIRQHTEATAAAVLEVARARLLLPPGFREPPGLEVVPKGPVLR
jgi:hypothetical protein